MILPIGSTIRELRREREITQGELAKVLGVTTQAVSQWERGNAYPDLELLPVIAAYFGVSVDRLLGMDE
ncbi:MAG: helix-turn-helix transcriptional regulator [Clostridia bacterium]|nr:helix-turn-helix transcriptional regulator [Clostridia bacterium]